MTDHHLVQVPADKKEGSEGEGVLILHNGTTQKLHLLLLLIIHWPDLNHMVS